MGLHPQIQLLIKCIDLEEKEQAGRYSLDQQHPLRALKAEGLALHPLIITRKNFGYAEYPEISFKLPFPPEANMFRDGAAIECFLSGEEPVKGILLGLDGKSGEFRLFAPDFPDWIEEDGVGLKLAPDTRTSAIMKTALKELPNHKRLSLLFERLHGEETALQQPASEKNSITAFQNKSLNESQQRAVNAVMQDQEIIIIHGPPGTGKTTTLVEAIVQAVRRNEKVLVTAPSNTAVDNIARALIHAQVRIVRVGNTNKVDEAIFPFTPEGKMASAKFDKEIKQLRKRAEEFRRMALKYKRSYGKAEREQRNLLFKEVRNIRDEIKKLRIYNEDKIFSEADVVLGTPVGIHDAGIKKIKFSMLVMDEAGQCIEPLAWCVFPMAEKLVLAGDHWQLPPTVLSNEAAHLGLNRSILEIAVKTISNIHLLDTQYRMRKSIAGFSSEYFYNNLLQHASHLDDTGTHITFIDMAGSGSEETRGPDGVSLQNEGELRIATKLLETDALLPAETAFISPYSGQVSRGKEAFPSSIRVSTVDSFQGQEKENIILSLVRSNDNGEIGFLKDYRRMNVAMTRAKERLYIIGDSATLGSDVFYNAMLTYVEKMGSYRTVWEFND